MRRRKQARLVFFRRKLLWLQCALLLLFLAPLTGIGQDDLVDIPSFRAGCQALKDLRFSSATASFKKTWEELESVGAGDIEKEFVASRLLEAFVRNGETREAISWLQSNPIVTPSEKTNRWKALSLHAEGRFSEAALAYESLLNSLTSPPRELVLARSICLAQSGRPEAAYELVAGNFDPQSEGEVLQMASISLQAGKAEEAFKILSKKDSEKDTTPFLAFARLRIMVTILQQLNQPEFALARTLGAIDQANEEESALDGFLLLEETGFDFQSPPLQNSLEKWMADSNHPASAVALFFAPLLERRNADHSAHLTTFLKETASPLLRAEAKIRLSAELPGTSPAEEIRPSLEASNLAGGEVRLAFENASRNFRQERYEEAAQQFSKLATRQIGENRSRDLYNSAIAFLRSGNREQFFEQTEILRRENPRSLLVGNLEYVGGLTLASEASSDAAIVLKKFTQEYPNHPAQIDALLALAEFYLNQAPARPQAAREIFENLKIRPLTFEQSERFDYSKLWLERIERRPSEFATASEKFLTDWPNSSYRPEVAMLLAREHYETRKFEAARTLFHIVATEHSDSLFADTARFFEIKSTSDPLEAENGWRMLLSENTLFADQVRHELGLLHLAEDRFEEARAEFQIVIDSIDTSDPLRFATLGDIGYSYFREALQSNAPIPLFEKASDAFAKLVQLPEASEEWVYNASVRRGKCLEMLGRDSVALEIYQSIVNRSKKKEALAATTLAPEVSIWVSRAGFAAIDILSQREDWKAAIRVADDLSQEDGPRAIKASRLAERLRLEHWIWD